MMPNMAIGQKARSAVPRCARLSRRYVPKRLGAQAPPEEKPITQVGAEREMGERVAYIGHEPRDGVEFREGKYG